jgi:predicted RNA-binding Zn-ribbon protein involved in translation (DUF1610 family)
MQPTEHSQSFPFSFGTWLLFFVFAAWLVLWLGSIAFFHFNKNAALKRKLWPIMVVGHGVLFLMYVWFMGFTGKGIYFVVSAVAFISLLSLSTKFCDSCGNNIQGLFSGVEYCPRCGSKLRPQDLSRLDAESIARVRLALGGVAGIVFSLFQYFYGGRPSVMDRYPASAPSFVDSVSRFWYLINRILTRPYVALVLGVSLLVLSWYRRHDPKGWTYALLAGVLLPFAVLWITPH